MAERTIGEAIARVVESDPHVFSTRPCPTCTAITALLGRPFGCIKYAKTGIAPWERQQEGDKR